MARVEIPAPGDLIMDSAGNVRAGATVSLKLAGTATDVTHYSALTAGTSTTGGLVSGSDGTIVDGSGNRRYIEAGTDVDMTVSGLTRRLSPTSGGTPEFHVKRYLTSADPVQAAFTAADAAGGGEVVLSNATFTRSTTLTWGQNTTLRGEGTGSVINYTGSSHAIQFGSGALDVVNWTGLGIRNVKITGTSAGVSGIRVRGATRWAIENVTISGFTTGAGILINGASFIGKISGGRITTCLNGISAQKVGADGADGRGQAFNALEVCGQMEIQACTNYGILIGDPAVSETLPVVGMSGDIHDVTVEACVLGGIWNVSGYQISVHNNYFELNGGFDVRVGSAAGNTIVPVKSVAEQNFHNVSAVAYDFVRADRPKTEDNLVIGQVKTAVTCVAATNLFTKTAHQLSVDSPVAFSALTGGAGLVINTIYYVIASGLTANDFRVSATVGGAELDVTTDLTDSTMNTSLLCRTTASTSTYAEVWYNRTSNTVSDLLPAIIVDAGNYTDLRTHEQNGGASPYEKRTAGLWASRGVLAGPFVQIAGAVTDAAVTGAGWPAAFNGMFAIDTTNFQIYVRMGGVWKKTVALT